MTTPEPAAPLTEAESECTHEDERGSTVMRVRDDRWSCAVCGARFRLTLDAARATSTPAGLDGSLWATAYWCDAHQAAHSARDLMNEHRTALQASEAKPVSKADGLGHGG